MKPRPSRQAGVALFDTVSVILNPELYKPNRDCLIAAYVPEVDRYTAKVFPFVKPGPDHEVPQTLIDKVFNY